MKKAVIAILLLALSLSPVWAVGRVEATYSEETELVSIVAHLAGIPGYDWDEHVLPDYQAEVDSFFAPYRKHRAVRFAQHTLMNRGFNWNFPMAVALRMQIVDGHILLNDRLDASFDNYYYRITSRHEQKFMSLLENFYRETDFHRFFTAHRPLYMECEQAMQQVLESIDFGWYDTYFEPRENNSFRVYLGILIGPGNYAVHQRYLDGREVVNAVMGCCTRDEDGHIFYSMHYTLPIIVHECNHSYCNPLDEAFWPQISDKATEIFNRDPEFYRSIAYGKPLFVMNETFVEACVIRYLLSHPIDLHGFTIEDLIRIDEDKKFVLIRDIIALLQEREDHPDRYPTMRDFIPRYIETVNNYNTEKK